MSKSAVVYYLFISALLYFASSEADAQASNNYSWSYWGGKQGSYSNRRLINIEYKGRPDRKLWRKAFLEAAKYYEKEDITYPVSRKSGDYFLVRGLSNTKKRIVGWYDYGKKEYGYVVIKRIANRVEYETNGGKAFTIGNTPSNYENWTLWDDGGMASGGSVYKTSHLASVQVWKAYNSSSLDAAVGLWFRTVRQ